MTLAHAFQPDDEDSDRRADLHESLSQFVRDNHSKLLKFLVRQCFDHDLAEDALQEALIVTMAKWEVVSKHEKPLYWVRKTAWHKFLTLNDTHKRAATVPLDKVPEFPEPAGVHEAEMQLRYVLGQLPLGHRAVLALMVERETDEQIALQLGLAVTTVRTYKSEIRKKYRELLSDGDGGRHESR